MGGRLERRRRGERRSRDRGLRLGRLRRRHPVRGSVSQPSAPAGAPPTVERSRQSLGQLGRGPSRSLRENVEGVRNDFVALLAPSRASDASFRDWYGRAGRVGASPATAARIWESVFASRPDDQLLDQVDTPTLVLYRRDNIYSPSETAQLAASQIRAATVVEEAGADHFPFIGDVDAVVAEVADFVVGERRLPPPQRLLAAVMFTDLVGSTARAASLGDAQWKSVLDRHDVTVRATVGRCGGAVVNTTGDGVLALMPSAAAAVRAATQVQDELTADGLQARIGIHVGDVDRRDDDVSGLAVNIAARAMAAADSGEIVVTVSVPRRYRQPGRGVRATGLTRLKGVPGTWELFRLADSN